MKTEQNSMEELLKAAELVEDMRYEEAFQKYKVLAENDDPTAQLFLGWMYQTGKGVQTNPVEARRWYENAASTQYPQAQFYLGNFYRETREYEKVFQCLERSASQEYLPAIYLLGQLYYVGEGVEVDRQKAFEYFKRAADKGHLFAQRNIARDMLKGQHGVKRMPIGFFLLIQGLWLTMRAAIKSPHSDALPPV